jgi:hypothetical protein
MLHETNSIGCICNGFFLGELKINLLHSEAPYVWWWSWEFDSMDYTCSQNVMVLVLGRFSPPELPDEFFSQVLNPLRNCRPILAVAHWTHPRINGSILKTCLKIWNWPTATSQLNNHFAPAINPHHIFLSVNLGA